jgi:mRNA-degrading endonuclease toxin of MazEF toxin-antitoxin module
MDKCSPSGEVWTVDFGCGGQFGIEFGKLRPAVVLSRRRDLFGEDVVIVVPLTTQHGSRGPTAVPVPASAVNRLNGNGVAVAHHLRAVDPRRLHRRIGKLEQAVFDGIVRAVAAALDLTSLLQEPKTTAD